MLAYPHRSPITLPSSTTPARAPPMRTATDPGSTTAQTPRRNLAVDTAADGEAASGKPLIRPEQDIFPDASPLAQSLPGSRLVFPSVLSTYAGCEKFMVFLPDHGCYAPLTGTRRRDPGLDEGWSTDGSYHRRWHGFGRRRWRT
jgi:hypothetical protein